MTLCTGVMCACMCTRHVRVYYCVICYTYEHVYSCLPPTHASPTVGTETIHQLRSTLVTYNADGTPKRAGFSRTFSSRPPNTTLAAQDLSVPHSTSLTDTNTYFLALTPREGEGGQHTPPHIRGPPHIWGGDNGVERMRTGGGDSSVWGVSVDGRGFATPTGGHTHRLMHSLQSPQTVTVLTNTRSSRLSSLPLSLSLASPPSGLCLALSHSTPAPPPHLSLFAPSLPRSL